MRNDCCFGWDRILACVGKRVVSRRLGNKNQFGTPGKSGRAVFAFKAQGLRSETSPKKCKTASKAKPSSTEYCDGGFLQPISSEPAPSHRPWASARARPLADRSIFSSL